MRVQFYTNMIAETWSKYFNKNAIHLHQLKPNEVRAFEPLLIKHSVNYDHFYQRLLTYRFYSFYSFPYKLSMNLLTTWF